MTWSVHKDLGIVMSDDLLWNQLYEKIIPKAYRMLGLLRRCFSQFQSVFALILIIGEIASYILFNCLETKPDKRYYTCRTKI